MRPRVLHVIEAIEAGVARHVRDLVRLAPGEHVVVVPPERLGGFTDTEALESMRAAGADVHLEPMRRSVTAPANLRAALAVRRLIREERIDIVHGHASIGGAVARLAAAGTGAARVYTPNGLLPARGALAAERVLGRITDRLVAVSASEGARAAELGVARRERIVVIPNGIELEPPPPSAVNLRGRLGVGPETKLVGTVGRLAPQKAPEVFLAACELVGRDLEDARFVLIGDGPMRAEVARLIAASPVGGRILHLPGLANAAAVLPQLDAFVLASRYEAGPYAPLEAMRAAVPVVLSDVIGNRDVIEHERSGLLVPSEGPAATAAAVTRLLTDERLRADLVAAASKQVADHFDVRRMAVLTGELYQELAEHPRGPRPSP